jgi:hypothetical protein
MMPDLRGIGTQLSRRLQLARRIGLTPIAAAGSAVATLVACVPTCFGAAAATAGIGLALGTAQPWLLAIAVVFLGLGVGEVYRAKGSCMVHNRTSVALLVVSAAIVTFVLVELLG